MPDDKPRFAIDGAEYEIPDGDSLTMAEMVLPYRYASHSGIYGDAIPSVFFMLGALHAGIARAKPKSSAEEIEDRLLKLTGADMAALQKSWEGAGDTDDPPPVESADGTSSPGEASASGSELSPVNGHQPSTGDLTSAISSASGPATSAT